MIRDVILKEKRDYFIGQVKAPLMKAMVVLANRYPEPTLDNVDTQNDKVWVRVFDEFLSLEDNPGRFPLFKAIKKLFIGEAHHDPYYRDRIHVILELWLDEVLKGNWKPRSLDHPESCWKGEKNVRGAAYKFLMDCYYHKEAKV
jgi:hypothetical protein